MYMRGMQRARGERRTRVRNTQALTIILLLAQLRRYCFHTGATRHSKRFAAASAIVRVIQPAGFLRSSVPSVARCRNSVTRYACRLSLQGKNFFHRDHIRMDNYRLDTSFV